jgi:hypothetical protein
MSKYVVTGPVAFMGHPPGDTFEAELDPALEARAIARGSIKKTTRKKEDGDAETDRATGQTHD